MLSHGDLTAVESSQERRMELHRVGLWFPKLAGHENYLKNSEKTDFLVSPYP